MESYCNGDSTKITSSITIHQKSFLPRTNPLQRIKGLWWNFSIQTGIMPGLLVQGIVESKTENVSWFVNVFTEQDAKSQPLQLDLDNDEQQILSNAGDDLLAAISTGVDSVAFTNNLILYKQVDSLGFSPVYVFSTNPDSAFYQVVFSDVGEGNGRLH